MIEKLLKCVNNNTSKETILESAGIDAKFSTTPTNTIDLKTQDNHIELE